MYKYEFDRMFLINLARTSGKRKLIKKVAFTLINAAFTLVVSWVYTIYW
ncbi:MAG: hypothetical protein PVJ52_02770 [Candidatus Woesebacteria bacterium]|jgi:hypothetical protein